MPPASFRFCESDEHSKVNVASGQIKETLQRVGTCFGFRFAPRRQSAVAYSFCRWVAMRINFRNGALRVVERASGAALGGLDAKARVVERRNLSEIEATSFAHTIGHCVAFQRSCFRACARFVVGTRWSPQTFWAAGRVVLTVLTSLAIPLHGGHAMPRDFTREAAVFLASDNPSTPSTAQSVRDVRYYNYFLDVLPTELRDLPSQNSPQPSAIARVRITSGTFGLAPRHGFSPSESGKDFYGAKLAIIETIQGAPQ